MIRSPAPGVKYGIYSEPPSLWASQPLVVLLRRLPCPLVNLSTGQLVFRSGQLASRSTNQLYSVLSLRASGQLSL